jgi:signal transduction histidine kinase
MAEYFAIISRDTDKLTRLVKNLLDFSRIEEGRAEYTFEPTDIAQLVGEQVGSFGGGPPGKTITVRLETAGDIPVLLLDRDAVSQALANLLDNAAKFSPAGTEIHVSLTVDGDRVILEVRDRGIGIPADEIGKVFDKFYQARNALRLSVGGTGLGLPLVKHILEAHGGEVRVKSEPGRGSAFSLIFPVPSRGG